MPIWTYKGLGVKSRYMCTMTFAVMNLVTGRVFTGFFGAPTPSKARTDMGLGVNNGHTGMLRIARVNFA